jgi:hypothetical protein
MSVALLSVPSHLTPLLKGELMERPESLHLGLTPPSVFPLDARAVEARRREGLEDPIWVPAKAALGVVQRRHRDAEDERKVAAGVIERLPKFGDRILHCSLPSRVIPEEVRRWRLPTKELLDCSCHSIIPGWR